MSVNEDSSGTLRRLQAGGIDELTKLFMSNRETLRDMVARRIRGRLIARFDASDIVQESFIRAKRQLAKYLERPQVPPLVWLRLLCKQLLAESIRKNLRSVRTPMSETHNVGDQLIVERIADSLDSVGREIARRELMDRVHGVLTNFSSTDRELIEMRHSEGLTFPEIAKILDIKMETAKKRYYRALKKFRDICAEDDIE